MAKRETANPSPAARIFQDALLFEALEPRDSNNRPDDHRRLTGPANKQNGC